MIERIWSGQSPLYLLLLPFSWLYGLVNLVRRACYRIGLFSCWRAPVPVIVVGNLTAGGNGKTPVVIWLAEQLLARGKRVGVVSRGYGGKSDTYPLVVDEHVTTAQAGDEPVLIYQRIGVPVAVAPRRSEAVKALLARYSLDAIITDDGLQHYALARDLELVVIDGERRFGNGWWLPAGPMRERAGRLKCVGAVIVNGGQAREGEIPMALAGDTLVNLRSGERRPASVFPEAVAMAGIGHPPRFFNTLTTLGVQLSDAVPFADHCDYDEEELASLTPDNGPLIMTEKDAVKCRGFARDNWWYLPVDARFPVSQSANLLQKVLAVVDRK